MKSVLFFCSLLAASVSAAPIQSRQPQRVTVALSNDQTGAYAGKTFPADNTDKRIQELFGSTSVGGGGHVQATSAQLTAFPENINCLIKKSGLTVATLTAEETYVDLDGNPSTAIPVDLSHDTINCHV